MKPRSSRRLGLVAVAGACALLAGPAAGEPGKAADLIVRDGLIYAGDDAPPVRGDVVVIGDRIAAVGRRAARGYTAARVIEARGRIVAPGFIDPHTHPDSYIRSTDPDRRVAAPWAYQGVSTIFIGADGYGTPDIAGEARRFTEAGVGVNLVPYVGFGAVRGAVLKQDARAPTPDELEAMKRLVARGMCEGALGFSTGLFYAPQSFATTEEVIALAREAAVRGGIYDTHQRDESSYGVGLMGSVAEVLRIGREAGLPVHFAHIKALGVDVQGQASQVIKAIEQARAAGQDVTADQYPWAASGTSLDAALLPRWAVDGGRTALLARLDDPATLARIQAEMRENLRRRGGADSLLLTSADHAWTGKTLAETARAYGLEPVDAALKILRDDGGAMVASFNMIEPDIRLFMRQPWVVTGSDGSDGHPRQFATFPAKYARYVKAERVITVGEFIRGSTGRTADMFGLKDRGYLRPGHFADVVVLDPEAYAPRADYVRPRELSTGVQALVVNGRLVLDDGKATGLRPGRVLLKTPPAGTCG
ncbi:MAG: amidohydrolase family protein [Pseudomonadota bacterium]